MLSPKASKLAVHVGGRNNAIRSTVPENPTLEPNMELIGRPVAEIWPFEFFQDGGGRRLGFVRTENSAIRSAVPENPTLEPNMEWIGRPVAEIWPVEIFEMRGRSSVGRWSVGRQYIHTYIDLIYSSSLR